MDLNGRTRRDPFPDRQPVDYILGLDAYYDAVRIRRRERLARLAQRALITSIVALAAGAAAWVLS